MKLVVRFLLLLCVALAGTRASANTLDYCAATTLKVDATTTEDCLSSPPDHAMIMPAPSPLPKEHYDYSTITAENQSSDDDDSDDDEPVSKHLKQTADATVSFLFHASEYTGRATPPFFLPAVHCSFISSPRYIVFRSIRI